MAERPEDLNLPAAVVSRLMKDALPDGCNVSKEARQAVCRAASVFVLYLTSQSNSLAQQSKRKTVSGGDVIAALTDMDFDEFSDPLKEALQDHKNRQKNKKAIKKRRTDETVEAAAEEPTAAGDTAAEQDDTAAEELTAAPGEPTAAGDAAAEEPTAAGDTTD